MPKSMLEVALRWARKGFKVFPLVENSKRHPLITDPYGQSTTDEAAIRAWWTCPVTGAERRHNVAIDATGLIIADVDVGSDPNIGSNEYYKLDGHDCTLVVRTRSGGHHYFFNGYDSHSATRLRPNFDVKSHNGFVVAAGSVVDGVEYVVEAGADLDRESLPWVPAGLDAATQMFDPNRASSEAVEWTEGVVPELDRPSHLRSAVEWLKSAPGAVEFQGGNAHTLKVARALVRDYALSEDAAHRLMLEDWNAKCSPPWSADELRGLVTNAGKYASGKLGSALPEALFAGVAPIAAEYDGGQAPAATVAPPTVISATPFVWRDPAAIPPREWIYGRHLSRQFTSMTIAPGAAGKSSLLVADALAMATGRDLTGAAVVGGPKRVWLWNLEDPRDELERRIAATMLRYGITAADIGDRLFLDSGRQQGLCIATQDRNGFTILEPVVDALVAALKARRIDTLVIDPFVSSHGVNENDNNAIDTVAKTYGRVAELANCAIELVHHLRKIGDNEATAESSRGAGALVNAARSCRVLNRMTKDEAAMAGVENHRSYFRVGDDKNNLAPPTAESEWFQVESVNLPNGDNVGVVVRWDRAVSQGAHLASMAMILKDAMVAEGAGSYSVSAAITRLQLSDPVWRGRTTGVARAMLEREFTPGVKAGNDMVTFSRDGKREVGLRLVREGER